MPATGKDTMRIISKCANPGCAAPFDYREGRLFRLHRNANKAVRHFWFCGLCAEVYTVEEDGEGVVLHLQPAGGELVFRKTAVA
jgi:hypothetical protein